MESGNGTGIRAWRDPWIPKGPTFRPISIKDDCHYNRVYDFLDENGAWNVHRLKRYFLPVDIEAILKIRTSPRLQQDFLVWHPEKIGNFTFVSAHIDNTASGASSSRPDGIRPVWKLVWDSSLPEKMKIFACKIVSSALATDVKMRSLHLEHL
jgi:hypothetical protein